MLVDSTNRPIKAQLPLNPSREKTTTADKAKCDEEVGGSKMKTGTIDKNDGDDKAKIRMRHCEETTNTVTQ